MNNITLVVEIKKNIVIGGVVIVEGTSHIIYDYTKPELKAQKNYIKKMLESDGVILEAFGKRKLLKQSIYCDKVKLKAAITAFVSSQCA